MFKFLFFFSLFILNFSISAQVTKAVYYNTIDDKVFTFSKEKPDAPFDTITAFVNSAFETQEDRARAYYTWINLNIEFDEDYRGSSGYLLIKDVRDPRIISQRVRNVLEDRKAASEGIADLMTEFCHASKMPSYTVPGYIRRPDGTISGMSFVWNVLYFDSIWVHVDASMANGYLDGNYKYIRHPMKSFFFLPPSDFINDHYPHDPMWQLLKFPHDKTDFVNGNYFSKERVIYGFEDSLKRYVGMTMFQIKEIDAMRYFKYESDMNSYERNLEFFRFDRVSDKMEIAIEYYDKYFDIGENKLSKKPIGGDWRRAKEYLEKSKVAFVEAELMLKKIPLKSANDNKTYDLMYFNLQSNMTNVLKNLEYLEKLKPFLKDK